MYFAEVVHLYIMSIPAASMHKKYFLSLLYGLIKLLSIYVSICRSIYLYILYIQLNSVQKSFIGVRNMHLRCHSR